VQRYWKRIGGALLDRIDIRVPLTPVSAADMAGDGGEASAVVAARVARTASLQRERYRSLGFASNARLPPAALERFASLAAPCTSLLAHHLEKNCLSTRAYHSIIRVSRTIADLEGFERIHERHLHEAIHHRRYGEAEAYWDYK
jgi:magnesium chelatase family protein